MIYTVTLNPSIDYVIKLEHLNTGHVNRVNSENVYPGGKGINVSRILKTLGNDNVATGFVSNFTGDFIKNSLYEQNIKSKKSNAIYGCRNSTLVFCLYKQDTLNNKWCIISNVFTSK